MSSELFDNSFFYDPFSSLNDSSIDLHHDFLQSLPNTLIQDSQPTQFGNDSCSFDQIASIILSSSPPSHQLENLSLYQTSTLFQNGCPGLDSLCTEFSPLEVKREESPSHVSFDTTCYEFKNSLIVPEGCLGLGTSDNAAAKFMQRSYSSNCFDNNKPNCLFQPYLDSLMESTNFQNQIVSSPEITNFSSNQMRRVCSTGDLHMKTTQTRNVSCSSPLSTERSFIEEAINMKAGKYSADERKERIDRYRAKRNQRNFNKTIKYACRKTLADNRPRIRGRFARNDGAVEIPKIAMFNRFRFEDEEVFWVEGYHEEEEPRQVVGSAPLLSSFNMTHNYRHQYHTYPW